MSDIVAQKTEDTKLDLVIEEINLGKITTNMQSILDTVKEMVEGYKIENYAGDKIAEAKSDRAALNAAAKKINDKRKEYQKMWMKPFDAFGDLADEACTWIKTASTKIDALIKDHEQGEKDEKRRQIEVYFATTKCELFPLDKIFVPAWTNKTVTMKSIQAEILSRIEKANSDLAILEKLNEPEAKVLFLETLDLNSAIAAVERIKANRTRLAEAEEKRLAEPRRGFGGGGGGFSIPSKPAAPAPLPAPVHEPESEPEPETPLFEPEQITPAPAPLLVCTVRISATRAALVDLIAYMDQHGIGHERIVE